MSLVSFHKLGVRKPYVLETAWKVALRVFSRVFVDPADEVYASWTPASWRRRLTAGEATRPVPRGAGMSYGKLVTCSGCHKIKNTYSDTDGTALAALLGWQRVRLTEVGTPVSSSDWNHAELCDDDGGTDGSCDFLGGLDTETNVTLRVSNNHDGLETCSLTGTGLLLHRLDLYVDIR
jgi:hypothetical protein